MLARTKVYYDYNHLCVYTLFPQPYKHHFFWKIIHRMYIFIHMLYKYCRSLLRNFRYVRRFRAWKNIVFILHDVKKIQAKFLVFCLFFYTEKKVDFNQFSLSFHSSKKERKLKSSFCRISSTKNIIPSCFWPCENCIWWWVSISLLLQSSTYIIIIFLHWNSDKKKY